MIVSAHRDSGFKNAAVRGRGWRVIRGGGLGQAGHGGGAGRAPFVLVNSDPLPVGGAGVSSGGAATRTPQTNPQPVRTGGLPPATPPATQQQNPPPVTPPTCPTGTALDYYRTACVAVQTTQGQTPASVQPPTQLGNGFYYYPGDSMVYNGTQSWDCNSVAATGTPTDVAAACSAMGYTSSAPASTSTTNYLPWVLGGATVLVLVLAMMTGQR